MAPKNKDGKDSSSGKDDTAGKADAAGGNDNPDQDAEELVRRFVQKKDLVDQEPSLTAAFGPSAQELAQGRDQARLLDNQGPGLSFDDAQRQRLGGQRFPDLQGVVSLFADGLELHPEIVDELRARPEFWRRLVRLDQALGRAVWCGELFWHGGESGELITAAAAHGLGADVLRDANARKDDPRLPAPQRSALAAAVTEPNRLEDERRARQQDAKHTTAHAEQPYQEQISQAAENAATSRVIEAFLAAVKKESP